MIVEARLSAAQPGRRMACVTLL
ncbi:protein of unknown function [Burkholderia multivorans]